ncbi:MAG: hypothetical protein V3T96_05905 [Thermodesulfobacteriota bacterium]|jgi:hypothetical protein
MTFIEYLKHKKSIDVADADITKLMDKYFEEYREFLLKLKDGCGPEEG